MQMKLVSPFPILEISHNTKALRTKKYERLKNLAGRCHTRIDIQTKRLT